MSLIKEGLQVLGGIVDDLHTSKEEMANIRLKEKEIDNQTMLGQMEINKEEAKHKSVFVAGWRPFIGWVCGSAFAYNFILYPILKYLAVVFSWANVQDMPVLDLGQMMPVILGMLGIGAMRSYDKKQGTNTDAIKGMSGKELRHMRKMARIEARNQ